MESYVESEEAKDIFGIDFFGPDAVASILGGDDLFGPAVPWNVSRESVRVPFSRDHLRRAKSLGMALIFRLSYDKYGNRLTIWYLRDLAPSFRPAQTRFSTMFGDRRESPWYAIETFARTDVPTAGWNLIRNGVIPRSLGQTWKEQRETLRQWTGENVIQPETVRRRTAVEAVYDALLFCGRNRQAEMAMLFDWTATISSDGWPVFVGCHDSRLWVDALPHVTRDPCVGVCPCLSAICDPVP